MGIIRNQYAKAAVGSWKYLCRQSCDQLRPLELIWVVPPISSNMSIILT